MTFDYRIYTCDRPSIDGQWLLMSYITVFLFAPPILVVAASVLLVKHLVKTRESAGRAGGSLRWQGIMTTILVASAYCISALPYGVYRFAESFISEYVTKYFHDQYYRAASSLFFLNTISNFYIYACTVSSFREFVRSEMKSMETCIRHVVSSKGISTVR